MSGYSVGTATEPTKPGFLRRPVPMWAFLLLVGFLLINIILTAFIPAPQIVAIKQPIVITSDSQTIPIVQNLTSTLYFTVANLNLTNTITTTANATFLTTPASNMTLTILGVQTGSSPLVSSGDGKTVSFLPGGNFLVVRVVAGSKAVPGSYTVKVALAR